MKFASGLAAALALAALSAAAPARADVKAGVDAWTQGDYERAVAAWRPLAVAGDADAQFNMGQAYKLGRGVPVDLPQALDWYKRAHDQGHERATDNYGLLLFQQGRREDAMPIIRASAERGEPRAQYIYATSLFNGDLVPQDWVRAYALMSRAAQGGVGQAADSLRQMDQYIPADQRERGLALAAGMAAGKAPAPAPVQIAQAAPLPQPAPPGGSAPAARPVAAPVSPVTQVPVPASVPAAPSPVASPLPTPKPVAPPAAKPAPAPAPTMTAAANGRWRVQLGAFGEQGRAEALWKALSARVPGLSGLQPFLIEGGGVTRLQAGPLASQADAAQVCARIKAAGNACLVKPV